MKILQTGDLHLGKVLHDYSLIDDQKVMLSQLLAELRNNYDAVVITGDVYDRSVPPPEAVELFDSFLTEAQRTAPQTHFFIIPGNHDSSRRLGFGSHLLELANIHIAQEKQLREYVQATAGSYPLVTTLTDAEGFQVSFYSIPYTHAEETEQTLQRIAQELSDSPHTASIVISHCFVAGSRQSDSERIIIGTQINISSQLFKPFDYVALGHIHRPQKAAENAWYAGSPLAYSFSEAGQQKHFLSITITENGTTVDELPITPLRPLSSIIGTYDQLLTSPEFTPYENHYLEVRCTDELVSDNPIARLKDRFHWIMTYRHEDTSLHQQDSGSSHNESLERRKAILENQEGKENNNHRLIVTGFLQDLGFDTALWQNELDLFDRQIAEYSLQETEATDSTKASSGSATKKGKK